MPDTISVEAVREAGAEAPVIIDVRSAEEYRAGHLPGALHIPEAELADRMADLPGDRPVVTYCSMRHRGDSRSERAASTLRQAGVPAQALDGGIPAWERAGYPIERG